MSHLTTSPFRWWQADFWVPCDSSTLFRATDFRTSRFIWGHWFSLANDKFFTRGTGHFHLRTTFFLLVGQVIFAYRRQVFCSLKNWFLLADDSLFTRWTVSFHLRTTSFTRGTVYFHLQTTVFLLVGQLVFTCRRQVLLVGQFIFIADDSLFYSWDRSFSLADDKFLLVGQSIFICGRQVLYSWDNFS